MKHQVFVRPRSPLSYPGLALWVDATLSPVYQTNDTSSAYTTDGQTIGRIDDLSPRANHLTQATAGFRPIGKETQFNGLRSIRFDGTSNHLTIANGLGVTANGCTIFVIAKTASTSAIGHLCSVGWDGGGSSIAQGLSGASPLTVGAQLLNLRNGIAWEGFGVSFPDTTSHHVYSVTNEAGRGQIMRGDGEVGTVNTGKSITATNARTSMGNQYTSGDLPSRHWAGDIAMMAVWARALSSKERRELDRYFGAQYGITVT